MFDWLKRKKDESPMHPKSSAPRPASLSMQAALDEYLEVIGAQGALTPGVIRPADAGVDFAEIAQLQDVTLFDDLKTYLSRVAGYDLEACEAADVMSPELAWGMDMLSHDSIVSHAEDIDVCHDEGNTDYWPFGFLPILWDGSGSYVVVNCVAGSRSYGAVYDMSEGVGCNRLSASLPAFFQSLTEEVRSGLRRWEKDRSVVTVEPGEYLEAAARIFGDNEYFVRRGGRMGSQIVDWK